MKNVRLSKARRIANPEERVNEKGG